MKARIRSSKFVLFLFVFVISSGLGLAALTDQGRIYTALEKAFYLDREELTFIRPGLNVEIMNVTIPGDRRPVVTFRITDDAKQPLDRDGIFTPGPVSTSFVLAYIPQNADQHVSYTVRTQTSPITGAREIQASADSGGSYTSMGDGIYTYRFGTTLPVEYDRSTTHTLGIYSGRDLRDFGLTRLAANAVHNFVPDGRQVTRIRDVTRTESCNACHDPLAIHGGLRVKVELCVLCHTPQTKDPDTGNTVDLKVMTHKIHRGASLPSVRAGKPYVIIGFRQSVHDYSEVHFPQDIRNCENCHKDSTQVMNWLTKPTRATCGSCHDDVNFATGAGHPGGFQPDDNRCRICHWPEGEFEYDASIRGAHTVPYRSKQLKGVKIEILNVTNTGPGQKPTVQFRITNNAGQPIAPSAMSRLAVTIGGPTSDYRWYVSESATNATVSGGVASYTLNTALPANASGTYSAEFDGYINSLINAGTVKEFAYRDAAANPVRHFAVTGTLTPRRTSVDLAKCNACHDKLQLHGNNRNQVVACIICHNPTTTDTNRRPAAQAPPESVDMRWMIHKIHRGSNLEFGYTAYGFGNVAHDYSHVHYPGDLRNCLACHVDNYTVPLPATATAVTTPRNFWNPTLPTAAACLGCHDSIAAAAHAFLNTAPFGESCAVCHKESATASVSRAHAR